MIKKGAVMTVIRYRAGRTILALMLSLSCAGCAATGVNTQCRGAAHALDQRGQGPALRRCGGSLGKVQPAHVPVQLRLRQILLPPRGEQLRVITPIFLQERISSFYNNFGEVKNLTNSLFQLKGVESAKTIGRFVTNSTVGLGGLFDPATKFGLERHDEDFGKTLGYWGSGSGPYLVLPIFGPSSVRDAGGLAVDTGITYGIYTAIDPFGSVNYGYLYDYGITALDEIDARHQQSFRYYESGYPFEYYMVRFFIHEKREIESGKPLPAEWLFPYFAISFGLGS